MTIARTLLVLGVTGSLGAAVARTFAAHGWRIRTLSRRPAAPVRGVGAVDWRVGDAQDAAAVLAAAQGCDAIFHGVNPTGYRDWAGLAPPMLAGSIAAAKATGARILFPGNIYNFAPQAGPLLAEDAPQHPRTRKGRVRVAMERMLEEAAADGVRVTIVRAGDFFGPDVISSWFAGAVAKGGADARALVDPGAPGVGHAWAYVPDLAETFARLATRDDLPNFAVFHFAGHWCEPNRAIAEAARDALCKPDLPIRPLSWWPVWLGAPFSTFLRELLEMRYLWRVPLALDNRRLVAVLGEEPHTPLRDALRATLGVPARGCADVARTETWSEAF